MVNHIKDYFIDDSPEFETHCLECGKELLPEEQALGFCEECQKELKAISF